MHTFKRDYVNVHELRDGESVRQLAAWIDGLQPAGAALGARHAEPGRLPGANVSEPRTHAPICLGLWGADQGALHCRSKAIPSRTESGSPERVSEINRLAIGDGCNIDNAIDIPAQGPARPR